MQFEAIASGIYLEGLAIAGGDVWFTDVIGGGVGRIRGGRTERWCAETRWLAAVQPLDDGSVLISGADGIVRLDPESGATRTIVAAEPDSAIPGVNEMTPDGAGGVYFGTVDLPAIQRGDSPAPASLFRLDAAGGLTRLDQGLSFTNGMALDPARRRLYHNASFDGVYAYDVAADGTLANRRRLIGKPDCDGMALDAEGFVWISGFGSDHLLRLDGEGTIDRRLELPGRAATNVRFGGADQRDLYVTIVDPETVAGLTTGTLTASETAFLHRARADVAGAAPLAVSLPAG